MGVSPSAYMKKHVIMREVKIFCPKCTWEPVPADVWACTCGHLWNTFETGGHCPACGKAWQMTQCLSCLAYSPHEDWYHEFTRERKTEEKEDEVTIGF